MSRTSTILLLTGDYADRLEALYSRALVAEREATNPRRLGDTTEVDGLRAEYEALREEAEAAGVKVVLRSLGRREWRDLKQKHPPRVEGDEDDVKGDRLAGLNLATVEDDLVHAALVEPELSRAAFDEWVGNELTEADFQAILARAWELVNVARTDPKALPSSPTRSGGESSPLRVAGT